MRISDWSSEVCSSDLGGWGAVLRFGEKEKEISGGEAQTTNNRMEMIAAVQALETLKRPCRVTLHTDSKYVMDGITKWVFGWQKNGWKTADRKPVKNARSEEHTSEFQSLMRISYAVFCLKKKKIQLNKCSRTPSKQVTNR